MKNENFSVVAYFTNLKTHDFNLRRWEEIVNELKTDERLRDATLAYRRLRTDERLDDATRKKQLGRLKQNQHAFVPSVWLKGGRTVKHITGFTSYIMVDLDKIPVGHFAEVLQRVKADPHVFLCYVTLSGCGIRAVTRVDTSVTAANFKQVWQAVNHYYARLAGVEVDEQCKNATRLSAMAYDPEALYRPDAALFKVVLAPAGGPKKKSGVRPTARHAAPTVRRLVEKDGVQYTEGHHNNYICRCLYWMNRFGVSQQDAEAWAVSTFADYDEASVRASARSCYMLLDEHNTERLSKYASGKDVLGKKRAKLSELEAYLQQRVDLRRNKLIRAVEWRLKEGDGAWQRLSDWTENSLWCAMQRADVNADLQHLRTLLLSDFVPEHDPLREYIDALEPWDGVTDYIGQAAAMVEVLPFADSELPTHEERVREANQVFAHYFTMWFTAMVAGGLMENVVNHTILTLIGRQGCYKSTFMRHLMPPELARYCVTKTNTQRLGKDDAFALTENLEIILDEIGVMDPDTMNQLKSYASLDWVNERPVYGRYRVRLPRNASFCATGNNKQFINGDNERRFLVFEVKSIVPPGVDKFPYAGMYAQAKALIDSGFRYWFDEHEIKAIQKHVREFELPKPEIELIRSHYRIPRDTDRITYLTATDVLARHGNGSLRLNLSKIGRAFSQLGFTRIHTRTGNVYEVCERTTDEMLHYLPES